MGSNAERAAMPVSGGSLDRLAGGVRGNRAVGDPVESQPMCEESDPGGGWLEDADDDCDAPAILLGAMAGVRVESVDAE